MTSLLGLATVALGVIAALQSWTLRREADDQRRAAEALLLARGVSARVVMEILGHSQIAPTMNTYSHVAPELRDAADPVGG